MESAKEKTFPLISPNEMLINQGLTKREYFAAMAMQGLLASGPPKVDKNRYGVGEEQTKRNIKEFIKLSIQITDELLKQLES